MVSALLAVGTAFLVVFLAELGDKSEVLLLAQVARARPWRVYVEAIAAFAVLTALAVTVGALVATWVPQAVAAIGSGLLFLVFGALALREARRGMDEHEDEKVMRYGGTFALVFVSEMGDKTQIATAALAASSGQAFATGFGAFGALAASSLLAVVAGAWLSRRLPSHMREYGSAALFFAVGAATVVWGVWLVLA